MNNASILDDIWKDLKSDNFHVTSSNGLLHHFIKIYQTYRTIFVQYHLHSYLHYFGVFCVSEVRVVHLLALLEL